MINRRSIANIVASSLTMVAVLVLIALWTGSVAGQSGRRGPKSASTVPAPTPEATPVEKKHQVETKPEQSFVIGIDQSSGFSDIPMYFYDTVLRACGERLDDPSSVRVTIANREMNRGEAVKKAKAETESHVVWLQLRVDSGRQSGDDLSEIYIEYLVFAPTTAKIVTSGRTYQQVARAGGVIAMPRPGGRISLPYTEQMLKRAARDAAERILSAMNISGGRVPG